MDQDLGCLQHVDERLNIYGWETGTGARFAIITDAWGKEGRYESGREGPQRVLKDGDVKSVGLELHNKGIYGYILICVPLHQIRTRPLTII